MKKMTRSKQLKLEKKKRKKNLAHRAANVPELAYTGSKYRKDKYIPVFFATESAILETFVISKRRLTDDDVREGLTTLITWLRAGTMTKLEDLSSEERETFAAEDFLAWNIMNHWKRHFENSSPVGRDVLVGVLRTTLASIDVWESSGRRGYLHYIEKFLGDAGVEVREVSPEEFDSLMFESERP